MADTRLRLNELNLNLLLSLDALLQQRSVTEAARSAGVTQSAMSHSLRQLRRIFGDSLLVRGSAGMVPTPRAEALMTPLHDTLLLLQTVVRQGDAFGPTSDRHFRIAACDYLSGMMTPIVCSAATDAPHVSFELVPYDAATVLADLESGAIDIALGDALRGPGMRSMPLLRDRWVCAVRRDHRSIGAEISLDTFAAARHVEVVWQGAQGHVVARAMERAGLPYDVAVRTPFLATSSLVSAMSDLVLTAPRRLCELNQQWMSLRLLNPPIELPEIVEVAVWHERFEADAGHAWLRESLADAASFSTHSLDRVGRARARRRARRVSAAHVGMSPSHSPN